MNNYIVPVGLAFIVGWLAGSLFMVAWGLLCNGLDTRERNRTP